MSDSFLHYSKVSAKPGQLQLQRHALANFCPNSLAELKTTARGKLRSGQRRQSIITACWRQAELW
jgi:hypothetical protein